jgi:phosphatidylglycerophosphate synthase
LGLIAQFGLLVALTAGVGLGPAGWAVASAYAVAIWAGLSRGMRRAGSRALGPANVVTLVRASLVVGVTALAVDARDGAAYVALITLAAVALVLDGVDGQVARRTGTTSPLGARFDMETDAFLILVLSLVAARSFGWWVLAIGVIRYAFVAAAWALPWLRAPLPPRFARKTVAAMQGIVLVVAAAGVLPGPLAMLVVAGSLALLCWSFGRDVGWLWRARGSAAGAQAARGHLSAARASGRPAFSVQWITTRLRVAAARPVGDAP